MTFSLLYPSQITSNLPTQDLLTSWNLCATSGDDIRMETSSGHPHDHFVAMLASGFELAFLALGRLRGVLVLP